MNTHSGRKLNDLNTVVTRVAVFTALILPTVASAAADGSTDGSMNTFSAYWPWWLGALVLGGVTIGAWWSVRQTLGASGSWERVCDWSQERKREAAEDALANADSDAVLAALMAETAAQFGADAVAQQSAASTAPAQTNTQANAEEPPPLLAAPPRAPVNAHLAFLVMLVVGGMLGSLFNGGPTLQFDMGPAYAQFFGTGLMPWITLFVGGMFVGFGARLGGGCTVGHGLTGMANLQIGSMVGTMAFFGTAIAVSFLLEILKP